MAHKKRHKKERFKDNYNQEEQEQKYDNHRYNPNKGGTIKEQLEVLIGEIKIKPKTENQKKFLKLINDNEIVITSGPAGTGKTFLMVSEALRLLKNKETPYKKIVLIKSITQLKNEEIGFIKGSVAEKLSGFMYSFMYIFNQIIGKKTTDILVEQGFIEVVPLSFIRGMNWSETIIIVDEAQNISLDNMETVLTRISHNSKMVLVGDTKQIDIKNKKESSLKIISEKFQGIDKFGVMAFEKDDQVRNPIINVIEDVFDKIKEGK